MEDLRDSRETLRVGDKFFFMCMQGIFFVHDFAVSIKHSLSHFYIYIDKVTLSPPAESVSIVFWASPSKRG